ncbi:hypothetical protein ACKAAV_003981 [Proteus mirabilis]
MEELLEKEVKKVEKKLGIERDIRDEIKQIEIELNCSGLIQKYNSDGQTLDILIRETSVSFSSEDKLSIVLPV